MITRGKIVKSPGVYQIKSYTSGKVYVGSSINMQTRIFKDHLKHLRKNKHHNTHLQRHFNKYGEKDLWFSVIEICIKDPSESLTQFKNKLLSREDYWIKKLNPVFNMNKNAYSSLGMKMSEEVCLKFRRVKAELYGKAVSQYTIEGKYIKSFISISEAERCTKISYKCIMRAISNQSKTVHQKYLWAYKKDSIEYNLQEYKKFINSKIIYQFDLQGSLIKQYSDWNQAATTTGIKKAIIQKYFYTNIPLINGYIWTHASKPTKEQLHLAQNIPYNTSQRLSIDELLKVRSRENKPINQFTLSEEFIKTYSSRLEAAMATNTQQYNILKCLQGKRCSTGNFLWTYK